MLYLLLSLIFSINQFLIPPAYSQENLHLKELLCEAYDPATFQGCLDEVARTGLPPIKITKPIICHSSAECSFKVGRAPEGFLIFSVLPENKIIRRGDFSYSLLTIENTYKVTLNNLVFEDQSEQGCPIATVCPPLIAVKNSADILVDRVIFAKTTGPSLSVTDSRAVSVINSNFGNSFKTGLEIASSGLTQGLKIENNIFESNAGSALVFQAKSVSEASILNNQFFNNHSKGAYADCTFPCTGAQIKISEPTSNLRFANNKVSGGLNTILDSLGLYASGIEVGGRNISRIALYCNEINSNRGSGIVQSGPFQNISGISISENKIWGNGLNLNIPTATTDENNCFTKECQLSCSN